MIYGSVNYLFNAFHHDDGLKKIKEILMIKNCISESFFKDAFSCFYLTKRPIISKEDVFYQNDKQGLAIAIDGCVYNKKELEKELSPDKLNLKIPELIAKAYIKWGKSFANQLNGDFSICIYNIVNKDVLFFVDQLGIRPLATARIGSIVYFASDPLGLCKALFSDQKIDKAYLINVFMNAGQDFLLTPHKDLVRIKPGYYLCVSRGHQEMKRYWFPGKIQTDYKLTKQKVEQDLKHLVKDAVTIRSDSKLSASSHLSGGLDSSILAAYVRKSYASQKKFYGFSWSPQPDKTADKAIPDERFLVEQICRENDMIPIFSNFDVNDYLTFLSNWRYPSEMLFEKKIIKTAKAQGIDLIFSGWGGDEFISIANRGIDADLFRHFNLKHFFKKYPVRNVKKLASTIRKEILHVIIRRSYARRKVDTSIFPYLKTELKNNRIPYNKRYHQRSRREVHLQLINLNHIAARTGDWYIYGQLNGIEYRYPLLDIRIVEYMIKVPSKYLIDGNKDRIIFRELGKGMLSDKVLSKLSKSDPAKTKAFYAAAKSVQEQFMNEIEAFRDNPDLNFVDFKKLEKDIPKMSFTPNKNKPVDAAVFYCLKKAHEFTKGYYK